MKNPLFSKYSLFEIFDGSKKMELIKTDLSYNELCNFLKENQYKLFSKYVRLKIFNHWWDANTFLKKEVD